MKRNLYLSFVGVMFLLGGDLSRAVDIKPPVTIPLGKANGKDIFCTVSVVHTPASGGTDEVHLRFQAQSGTDKPKICEIVAGECSSDPHSLTITSDDYVGLGRKQVFVSAAYGRTASYLYDYDGDTIHLLYKHDEGREEVKFIQKRSGSWYLAEYWGYHQYLSNGEDDLGTAFVVYLPKGSISGEVVRMLHWNGSKFVPNLPGPTTIIRR